MPRFPVALVPQACEVRDATRHFEDAMTALEAMLPASAKQMVIAVEAAHNEAMGAQRDLYEALSRKGVRASVVRRVLDA